MRLAFACACTYVLAFFLMSPVVEAAPAAPTHWQRGGAPVAVTIYDRTASALWGKALRNLAAEWNAGTDGVEFIFSSQPANCETGQGPFTVVVCVRENSSPNHAGEAYLYSSDGIHISQVTIWMDPRPKPNRENLACHELGHALGLGHRGPDEPSCMANGPHKRPVHPDQRDFKEVSSRHAHIH